MTSDTLKIVFSCLYIVETILQFALVFLSVNNV